MRGLLGIDPDPFTFGELIAMAEGAWEPFAVLLAKVHNLAATKDTVKAPGSFNPYRKRVLKRLLSPKESYPAISEFWGTNAK